MDQKKGLRAAFKAVFGKRKEPEAEAEEQEPIKPAAELVIEEVPPEPMDWKESGRLPPVEGSLQKLWQMWAGDAMRPSLSLATHLEEKNVELDAETLEQEAGRMMLQLEQEAEKRIKLLEGMVRQEKPESLPAQTVLYVSRDRMLAWAFLFPPVGEGSDVQADEIGRAMQKSKVLSGIDTGTVVRLMQEKPYFQILPIAVGTPAVPGVDGELKEYYEETLPFEVKIDENGVADYKASNYVRQIMKDDVICDITYPVEGKPGTRVDGSVAEPKKVKPLKIPQGQNTKLTEDELHLVAGIDGNLEFRNGVFHISPVLVIPGDVDYKVGNIHFDGDVHIHGDVRENFSVTATGSITVEGLVEAADIVAGGDLLISRGVVGDDRALIRSRGCVRVKFLENCVVYAKESIFADCIMNSLVFSDNSINVSSGRGSVIGGTLTAAERIRANMVGAQSGKRTQLRLGLLSYDKGAAKRLEEEMEHNRKEIAEVDRQIHELEELGGPVGSDMELAKLRQKKTQLELKGRKIVPELEDETEEQLIPDLARCRLECNMVYPNTALTIHGSTWTVRESKTRCKVLYDVENNKLKEVY